MADQEHDPFTQGIETSPDDPFEGGDFGDFAQHDPDAPPPAAAENGTGELKTVDREGQELPPPAQPEADPTPAGPAPASDGPTEAAPDPTPSSTASSPATTASGSSEPGGTASAPTESAPAEPGASTQASSAEAVGGSAEQAGGDQGDPTPVSPEPPSPAATSSSSSGGSSEVEDAPLPEEPKDKRGRATARRYIILRVDGPGKFTQVYWYEDDKGKMLTKREPGSKRQGVALCKSAEEALKIGFAACGGPQDGANLVATAALHFQPKVVKPMPPEPSKQRLSIS